MPVINELAAILDKYSTTRSSKLLLELASYVDRVEKAAYDAGQGWEPEEESVREAHLAAAECC